MSLKQVGIPTSGQ
jgi:tetratricopeptide (TPR) repeat protein